LNGGGGAVAWWRGGVVAFVAWAVVRRDPAMAWKNVTLGHLVAAKVTY